MRTQALKHVRIAASLLGLMICVRTRGRAQQSASIHLGGRTQWMATGTHRAHSNVIPTPPNCHIPVIGVTIARKSASACIAQVASIMPVVVVGLQDDDAPFSSQSLLGHKLVYLSLARQNETYPALTKDLSVNSHARKNTGYLHALRMGACHVWDFDDEHCLGEKMGDALKSLGVDTALQANLALTSDQVFVNPYPLYGSKSYIWPRGYPVELAGIQEFPRLTRNDGQGQIDVVHFMADGIPDIDAHWSTHHSHELPFNWAVPNSRGPDMQAAKELVAVDPSRWAPFNARSTLLTRRAARVAMLPPGVDEDVADVWRSYVMQYLMKQFSTQGLLAYCGATVKHGVAGYNERTRPDRRAGQLRPNVTDLVRWLERRPVSQGNAARELVLLFKEARRKGYVAAKDVAAVRAWAQCVEADEDASARLVRQNNRATSPPPQRTRADVGVVLHVNNRHVEVVPTWLALHGHKFRKVFVYCPSSPMDMISGVPVRSVSEDFQGVLAYESMVNTIEMMAYDSIAQGLDGLLFLHDDVIWREQVPMGGPTSFHMDHDRFEHNADWVWTNSSFGAPALEKFENSTGRHGMQYHYGRGAADEFYVAARDYPTFASVGRDFIRAGVFLELAVPSIYASFLPHARTFKLQTFWDGRRNEFMASARKLCTDGVSGLMFSHPHKLSSLDGILSHLEC